MNNQSISKPDHYFNFKYVEFAALFENRTHVWEVLAPKVKENWIIENASFNASKIETQDGLVLKYQKVPVEDGYFEIFPGAFLADAQIECKKGVVVETGVSIHGPTILGENTHLRQGAYIRGGVITGRDCLIGHATEVKSSIFLNGAKAAHFAYVGDSILGNAVNLGAGTKISNVKVTNSQIKVRLEHERINTGLKKMGAIIGDFVQTGCNAVLNPGVMLAPKCMIYPCAAVKNQYFPPETLIHFSF